MAQTILKEEPRGALLSFSFVSIEEQAHSLLEDARTQAQAIVAQSRQLAETAAATEREAARSAGHAEGFAQGLKEGLLRGEEQGRAAAAQAARQEFEAAHQPAAQALAELLAKFRQVRTQLLEDARHDLMDLALNMAQRICRRSFEVDDQSVVRLAQEAIALTYDRSALDITLHPDDLAALTQQLPTLKSAFSDLGEANLHADCSLKRGEVRVGSRRGLVAVSPDTQLQQMADILLGASREDA
ncbi:MAG: hypothetical protein HPKKFMNG_00201 [Planctomycetes bacterium]|nr:hypothetical protein [Planctomycetota bacterium]